MYSLYNYVLPGDLRTSGFLNLVLHVDTLRRTFCEVCDASDCYQTLISNSFPGAYILVRILMVIRLVFCM